MLNTFFFVYSIRIILSVLTFFSTTFYFYTLAAVQNKSTPSPTNQPTNHHFTNDQLNQQLHALCSCAVYENSKCQAMPPRHSKIMSWKTLEIFKDHLLFVFSNWFLLESFSSHFFSFKCFGGFPEILNECTVKHFHYFTRMHSKSSSLFYKNAR